MANSLVSIITPSYNCSEFIADTIRSAQAQTWKEWEMIIVDDCSTDSTIDIVNSFKKEDTRIHLIINSKNSGAAVSRNKALKEARGKWIAFLDSDDKWDPEKLEHQIRFMEENNYSFSYHNYREMNEDSSLNGIHVSGLSKVGKFAMFTCCWPGCLTVMYDREKIGLIQVADIKRNNDTAMWLKVVKKAPCHLLDEELATYRRRQNSITPTTTWKKITAHYPIFRESEQQNPLFSYFWTVSNIFGSMFKKTFYVKRKG